MQISVIKDTEEKDPSWQVHFGRAKQVLKNTSSIQILEGKVFKEDTISHYKSIDK